MHARAACRNADWVRGQHVDHDGWMGLVLENGNPAIVNMEYEFQRGKEMFVINGERECGSLVNSHVPSNL